MALFKILRGESINLADTPVTDGFAYFTPEDGKFYIDYGTSGDEPIFGRSSTPNLEQSVPNRICINDNKNICRFVVGTSTAGWTSADCDYLCDGTADQTEINAAITALPATGGEVVILDGTYNITAKINVTKDNVSIRGNGNATILKRMFDSSVKEGLVTLMGRRGCKIADLQVDGNKGSYTSNNNSGIYLYASSNNTVTGNTCNNNIVSGIYLYASDNNTVTGNTCSRNNDSGIYLDFSFNNNTVTGNICNSNNYGIYLGSSSNNTVTGNTCSSNAYYGVYLYGSRDNTVTGNNYNNNNYGIYLGSSDNNTVTGNNCSGNSHGIYLGTSSNNTVTGNNCSGNAYHGVLLNSSSNNNITGNTCIRGTGLSTDYTVSQHTIRLEETDNNYNLISNNNCMGKAVGSGGGTGNIVYGNKYDSGDYKDFTQDEKTKLAGIATGANNYTHPTNHPPSIITQNASNRFVTDTEKAAWNGKAASSHTHAPTDLTTAVPINKGGTGATTAAEAVVALGVATKQYVDAIKSTQVSANLTTTWAGRGPYTQAVTIAGMTTTKNGMVGLAPSANAAQREAAKAASLMLTSQGTNTITITADGDKPTVALPIVVTMLG